MVQVFISMVSIKKIPIKTTEFHQLLNVLLHMEILIPIDGELLNMDHHGIILTLVFKHGKVLLVVSLSMVLLRLTTTRIREHLWGHETVDELYQKVQTVGPQSMTTGLINGTNVFGADGASNQTGSRFSTSVQSGKSYRFRLVNSAIDSQFKFSVDSHTMTVMAMDFVPIVPYQTEILNIAIG